MPCPAILLCAAASLRAAETFQLSIPQPASHKVPLELGCDALTGEFHDSADLHYPPRPHAHRFTDRDPRRLDAQPKTSRFSLQ